MDSAWQVPFYIEPRYHNTTIMLCCAFVKKKMYRKLSFKIKWLYTKKSEIVDRKVQTWRLEDPSGQQER